MIETMNNQVNVKITKAKMSFMLRPSLLCKSYNANAAYRES